MNGKINRNEIIKIKKFVFRSQHYLFQKLWLTVDCVCWLTYIHNKYTHARTFRHIYINEFPFDQCQWKCHEEWLTNWPFFPFRCNVLISFQLKVVLMRRSIRTTTKNNKHWFFDSHFRFSCFWFYSIDGNSFNRPLGHDQLFIYWCWCRCKLTWSLKPNRTKANSIGLSRDSIGLIEYYRQKKRKHIHSRDNLIYLRHFLESKFLCMLHVFLTARRFLLKI